jgi:hypothetical protein
MADATVEQKIAFYDAIKERGQIEIEVYLDAENVLHPRWPLTLRTAPTPFEGELRAAADKVKNVPGKGVAVGLRGTELVILAPAVDVP